MNINPHVSNVCGIVLYFLFSTIDIVHVQKLFHAIVTANMFSFVMLAAAPKLRYLFKVKTHYIIYRVTLNFKYIVL